MAHENDWVADVIREQSEAWIQKEWDGVSALYGSDIWHDGNNTYYSHGTSGQYVLDTNTDSWVAKTWTGFKNVYAKYVWTDGTDIYCSLNSTTQYVLDQSSSTWIAKTWGGTNIGSGEYAWSDGENTYYSYNANQLVLNKQTSTWENKTWNGLTSLDGSYVWTDGTDIYYSYDNDQYILDKSTSTWTQMTWNGLNSFRGKYIWFDSGNIYYSYATNSQHYQLDKSTNTWTQKTWDGMRNPNGANIWHYKNKTYYSYNTANMELRNARKITSTPYRLNFPELKESINPHEIWVTELDPDAPKSDITFDPNYRYVKLEFDVNITADNDNSPFLQATTDLPNPYMQVSRGYYWYQWSITLLPATSVASRLYAAEESATNLSDFMTHVDTYGSSVEARNSYPAIDLSMSPKKLQYTSIGDLDITGSIYSAVTNTSQYNDQRLDEYYRSYVGYTIYLNQTATGSSSSTVTVKLYYCFDQDESGYDALLAEYPNHASPYNPEPPTKVPYRLDFPEMVESIDINSWVIDDDIPFRPNFPELIESVDIYNSWLISDDIPFRWNFPPLIPTNMPSDSWLQDKGWDPRRPWPDHRSIIQKVQTIPNIPDVDWTKSMQQTFEFYTVDPNNWYDDQKLENIISCDLTHDLTSDKRGNASITVSEPLPECYIRTYLVVTQAGYMHKICLGTYLYMTSSDSFDGMKHNITMTGYTPMVELEEKLPPLGFHIVGITNRKHSSDAPMVTDAIKDIVTTYTRCEIENKTVIQKPLLNDFVAGSNDNFLTVINNILNASSLQQYILTVDEWGTIIVKDKPVLEDAIPTYIYTDDNSSILLPSLDTNDDIYGIPNVVEVLYTGDKRLPAIRVIVKNEDPTSIVSIQSRGREIAKRFTITNIAAPVNDYSEAAVRAQVTAQAERLLEAASTINKTISYSHGYCDVKVGDTVLINYERAGVTGIRAKVVSQRISCKPGCQVDEQAVYTKKLWNRGV